MRYAIFAPLALLVACGDVAPRPEGARLSADRVDLILTDGQRCSAPTGAGRMPLCGAGYDYRVDLVDNPNVLRRLVEGAFGALGAQGALAPMGVVTVVDDAGRAYRFVSPPPVPE
jgi:hypothetical protein